MAGAVSCRRTTGYWLVRLFVGIGLPPACVDELSRVSVRLRRPEDGLRWSSPASWHITLEFLGIVNEEQSECLIESLRTLRAAPFPVAMGGFGFFERVGIFFAAVELTPALLLLRSAVTAATSLCGYAPDTRAYHPHVTLARSRGKAGVKGLRSLQLAPDVQNKRAAAAFVADEVLLYESVPQAGGPRYEVRERFKLQEPAA